MNLRLSVERLSVVLLAIIIAIIAAHIGLQLMIYSGVNLDFRILERLHVDREASLPTWFSQSQLLIAAGLLGVVALIRRQLADKDSRYWAILALVFVYLSIDEGAELHELATQPMRQLFDISSGDTFYYAWVLLFLPLAILFALIMSRFLLRLPRAVMARFMLGGIIFIAGAAGVELLSSNHVGLDYELIVAVEEGFEMLGVWLFITGIGLYLKLTNTEPQLEISATE